MGASLLAIAVCQSTSMLLIYRYREQARSHIVRLRPQAICQASSLLHVACTSPARYTSRLFLNKCQ
ncbi:Hypothetical protein PSEBR_m1439 [Pseudomonas brassicacearum subsp. brassicacearum NFM421]|uniref:Uncharacterized protein n=1 Tax=Pseudomonas brassicacearum (strain NFM421) TaxID=994484 RepID=F2KL14_PSEBN|nr:Hypothetical protein PSEBR_m1439 [Pseudomonas brassicacearum subsp. brassicacearum NFM421]